MPLTDVTIRKVAAAKPLRLVDGEGLYLLVNPNGSKWWRFDYRFDGRRKTISLGVYPETALIDARTKRAEVKHQLANGVDPSVKRRIERHVGEDTFEAVAREWFMRFSPGWAKSHSDKIIRRLELNLFPWLGKRPAGQIEPLEILVCLRRIEGRGALDTAHRALQNVGQVLRYAVATGRAPRDISADLRGALPPARHIHYPTIVEPREVGALLNAIDSYRGSVVVRCALKLSPYVFTRPGELRKASWSEFDLDRGEWRIPAERMKSRVPHIVPLSEQAVAILLELKPLTESSGLLFPGRDNQKPMSDNTVNAALRRLGYEKDMFTAHSFRSMASTLLNELGWNPDAIERQLSHGERNKVRAAYNHAQHLPERRKMMTAWADHLDRLKRDAKREPAVSRHKKRGVKLAA
ncbi:tyrosine-type recombinase/integrase [Dokdonella ginsengisoli]|uniref:Tyrosine-type recombinase/integrase n=1 Tax=Dokdonella ginsengisoli TaxID=363846 RepID=A0ABV9QZ70_9GAMM